MMLDNMKTIAITIEEDILQRIDQAAGKPKGTPVNRSQFIREAVRDYLSRMEKTVEEEREREIFRRNRRRLYQQAVALIKEQAKP
jgi:metal-responsive CopG/Arc/MetJ family transcriptional regulator